MAFGGVSLDVNGLYEAGILICQFVHGSIMRFVPLSSPFGLCQCELVYISFSWRPSFMIMTLM